MIAACFSQVPIGQKGTTTSVAALVEKMVSLDNNIKNLESKFETVNMKRKCFEDKKKAEPKKIVITKPKDKQKQDEWDKIKADTTKFLETTPKVTDLNKHQWLDLMQRSKDSYNDKQGCMQKSQKKKINDLWAQYVNFT